MRLTRGYVYAAAAAVLLMHGAAPASAQEEKLKRYESDYYVIHSDLPIETIREAHARMTAVAEEYHRRTKGFSGRISRKFPFYFYSRIKDYHAAGGIPGSAGLYNGKVLMARADKQVGDNVWRVLQHEAWHQFMHVVVRGNIPIWVNEGLAEYFGEGIWTGDGLTTGVIPPGRLKRVKKMIDDGKVVDFLDMLEMRGQEWSRDLSRRNYDQAWSMCHFLIHADDGKYQRAFAAFIADISRSRPWRHAFKARFGDNVDAFQKRYSQWWQELDPDPTRELHNRATVATLAGYLARATVLGMDFEEQSDAFFEALSAGKIAVDPEEFPKLWLPDSLARGIAERARRLETWSLSEANGRPRIVLKLDDGTKFVGIFSLNRTNKPAIEVQVTGGKAPSSK